MKEYECKKQKNQIGESGANDLKHQCRHKKPNCKTDNMCDKKSRRNI